LLWLMSPSSLPAEDKRQPQFPDMLGTHPLNLNTRDIHSAALAPFPFAPFADRDAANL
jgi:hypothetical protein